MDRKGLLAVVPEEHRSAAETFLSTIEEAAAESGRNSVAFERRKADKAISDLTKERDKLTSRVEQLETGAADASGAVARVTDLEKQLKAITGERDALVPVVDKYRAGVLREAVTTTAKLKDPMLATALISEMGITLGDGEKLSEEHTKALTDWAKNPANAERVQGAKPAGPLANLSGFPSATPAQPHPSLPERAAAWRQNLSPRDREVFESAYRE